MAGTKEIKRRIKSVKNTKKITKAMELVAASKMKRSVANALASRLYASYSWDFLTSLSSKLEEITHPFFTASENNERALIVLITSNRGLCGAYNAQIIKKTISVLRGDLNNQQVDFATVGRKGDVAMRRTGQNVIATFTDFPDLVDLSHIAPLSNLVITEFKKGNYQKVFIAYTDFVSALTQKPNLHQLLPISKAELKETIESIGEGETKLEENKTPYIFEGDTNKLLESLAEKLVRMQIYQMILESNASEQSSRMLAMKNASDAAGEMIDDLTLVFNKARQAGITQEISEISAGMASIN